MAHPSVDCRLLSEPDNEKLKATFEAGTNSLCSTICQVLESRNGKSWQVVSTGILCFIKHRPKRTFFLECIDLETNKTNFRFEMYVQINPVMVTRKFITFDGDGARVGLNFYDANECHAMLGVIREKITYRKPTRNQRLESRRRDRGVKTIKTGRIEQMPQHMVPKPQGSTKKKIDRRDRRRVKIDKSAISAPVANSFQHTDGWEMMKERSNQKTDNIDEVLANAEIQAMFAAMNIDYKSAEAKHLAQNLGMEGLSKAARKLTVKLNRDQAKKKAPNRPKKRPPPPPIAENQVPLVVDPPISGVPPPPPVPVIGAPRPPPVPVKNSDPATNSKPASPQNDNRQALLGEIRNKEINLRKVDPSDIRDSSEVNLSGKNSRSSGGQGSTTGEESMEDALKKKLDLIYRNAHSDSESSDEDDDEWSD